MYTNYLVTFWCLLCDSVGFYKMNIDAISHTLYLVLCCTIWLSKCRQIKEISVKFYSVKQASIQVYIFALYPMSQRCLCQRHVQTVQRNWLRSNTALMSIKHRLQHWFVDYWWQVDSTWFFTCVYLFLLFAVVKRKTFALRHWKQHVTHLTSYCSYVSTLRNRQRYKYRLLKRWWWEQFCMRSLVYPHILNNHNV